MGWRDNLHLDGKGSFRGIEFLVDAADRRVGRRTVVHEYPGRDDVRVEDLGAQSDRARLSAYVLGEDYMTQRDRLYKAFKTPGAGVLVHPYWGRLTVTVVGTISIRETPTEGGLARFSLEVVETPEAATEFSEPDTAEAVKSTADDMDESLADDFIAVWNTTVGVVEAVRDHAQGLIDEANGVVSNMNKVNGYVNSVMNQVDQIGDTIQAFADQAAAIILTPQALVNTVVGVYADILGAVATVGDAWTSYFTDTEQASALPGAPSTSPSGAVPASGDERVRAVLRAYREVKAYGEEFVDVSGTTQTADAMSDNQEAMITLVRTTAVVSVARAIIDIPFASSTQASETREELLADIDTLTESADDDSYYALAELRTALSNHLADASADLPSVVEHTPAANLPALVIAQLLYGDATKESDVITRNNVRNPLKVPAGETLEVLSND